MEFISTNDDYQHPYLHHRNVLNPYTSPYAHRDFLGEDFGQDDEPYCPDDEETGQARAIMEKDGDEEEGDSSYQKHKEDIPPPSSSCPNQQEEHPCGYNNEGKSAQSSGDDHQTNAPDVKMGDIGSNLEAKLSGRLDQLKAVTMKRLKNVSEFCSWNCFFSLLFVVGVLLVFLDHYGSAYVRMMNMQKFFFFVMGVLTTTVAVVVVCVVVAFTSCYGGDAF